MSLLPETLGDDVATGGTCTAAVSAGAGRSASEGGAALPVGFAGPIGEDSTAWVGIVAAAAVVLVAVAIVAGVALDIAGVVKGFVWSTAVGCVAGSCVFEPC
jgi:hypothetical protein